MSPRVLVVRLDNAGDVLLAGPSVRAVAAHARWVGLLCGPNGHDAAALLPGVDRVLTWRSPWIDPAPEPVTRAHVGGLVELVRAVRPDIALVLTSFHQSALPTALVLRLAEVPWVGAISEDYPGSLLDLRHHADPDLPESERALSLAAAAGFPLPAGDDRRLRVRRPLPDCTRLVGAGPYVVVHPGASADARRPSARWSAELVRQLTYRGHHVVVTGSAGEADLTGRVAGVVARDLGGRTDFATLAAVVDRADAVVAPNTGTAHLAAATGTPVVSLFAPVVPATRWAPVGVDVIVLGDQTAPCRDTRARDCPVPGHPCLDLIDPDEAVAATETLVNRKLPA